MPHATIPRRVFFSSLFSVFSLVFFAELAVASPDCGKDDYLVGAAQDDITGPIAGLGMMGYADLKQTDEGLHMRLRSRAMVISDGCREQTVALVIGDLGQVFGGLKEAVVTRLQRELPGVFNRANVLFSATHTHSGPAGFAHHALYNITSLGFSPLNFETIADGTVRSIVKAYRQQESGTLRINRGDLEGIQFNRSLSAYEHNPAEEKAHYAAPYDPEMLLIRADANDGRPLGAMNWYAVHGVSLPMENKLVSGDNKGLAAYIFERQMGTSYRKNKEFVAGFFQANSGDISPYPIDQPAPSVDEYFQRNEDSARAQYSRAFELFEAASEDLRGPIQFAHKFADLSHRRVGEAYTEGMGSQETCDASLGVSFAAGTENGRPVGLFQEGTIYGVNWLKFTLMPREQACQQEKVILLPTGLAKPDPWTARVVPFQLLRIGQLAIVATPFEVTTMAGRRLKASVLKALAPSGVRYVAIAALANEYIHYVTTREEYAQQAYEGGSTLFGPWSLAAYTEIFDQLALSLNTGVALQDEARPLNLAKKQLVLKRTLPFDSVPHGAKFGAVSADVLPRYRKGRTISAQFWGAHPNHSIGRDQSLLRVEQQIGEKWIPVRYDWDPDTIYRWERIGFAGSHVTVSWKTNEEVPDGTYRLCHQGHSRRFGQKEFLAYEGCTHSFVLASSRSS